MSVPVATRRAPRLAVLLLVSLGGFAALSWEVLWQLQASLALGVSALGTALTLAATMGGMTLGSFAMGRALRRRRVARPARLYGALELVIGLSGLAMLPGFAWIERLDTRLYALSPELAPLLHVVAILLLLGPPTLAMGATIPVFELVGRGFGSSVAVLYGLNTAGAAAGVLLLSFFVLPALGVSHTCLLVTSVNAAVCLGTFLLPRGTPDTAPRRKEERAARIGGLPPLLVFGTGFVTFGLEVAWFRALRAAFYATTESFAIMLASVLVPLALGARMVPWLRRRGFTPGFALACAGAAILLATPLVERIDLLAPIEGRFEVVLVEWLLLSLAMVGPAMLFLGMVLPFYLEEFAEPAAAGQLYAVNTVGSVLGAVFAAWVLLPALGFARGAWLLGAAVVALALAASTARPRLAIAVAGTASLAVAMTFTSSLGRDRVQHRPLSPLAEIVAYEEGPDSTISVVADGDGTRLLLIDGFQTATELPGGGYMEWMGRLPMLLHPEPKRALVICFGTGQTANAVREESPDALDVVELNAAVLKLAPLFSSNRGVLGDPRVRAIVMDGRAWIRRSPRRYDVITLEPMPPYFAGVNALYSKDFYELLASRLEPGGVAAQWLPLHMIPPYYALSITATFRSVFPDSILWFHPLDGTGILLGRVAATAGRLGSAWPGLARALPTRTLTGPQVRRALALDTTALEVYAAGGSIITDDNQLLAYGIVRRDLAEAGLDVRRIVRANRDAIARAAGRRPFMMPPAEPPPAGGGSLPGTP